MSLEELRRQYTKLGLDESQVPGEPIAFFRQWLDEAIDQAPADWVEPYAMTLATSTSAGEVSARIVLLRGADESGFVFYTNYDSRKGNDLAENPRASLVFHWPYLERQVRIRGSVAKAERVLSETYFHKRPRGSQISAAISEQSVRIDSRAELESRARQLESELDGGTVPLPENWGGYRLNPTHIEFWQGRENRLHDRLLYEGGADGWQISRLSP